MLQAVVPGRAVELQTMQGPDTRSSLPRVSFDTIRRKCGFKPAVGDARARRRAALSSVIAPRGLPFCRNSRRARHHARPHQDSSCRWKPSMRIAPQPSLHPREAALLVPRRSPRAREGWWVGPRSHGCGEILSRPTRNGDIGHESLRSRGEDYPIAPDHRARCSRDAAQLDAPHWI